MRQGLVKLIARLPLIGPLYLKGVVRAIEKAPRHKLTPEMQQMQAMLRQIPEDQRLPLLRAAMKGELPQPKPGEMSRGMRRAAEKQARRRR